MSVLVAENNPGNVNSFTTVMADTEMPFLDWDNWNEYEVDLSAYAGKEIYIALRHTTNGASNVAFFDDFTFNHFAQAGSGIQNLENNLDPKADVAVYNTNGALVATGKAGQALNALGKGVYVVKVTTDGTTRTFKVVRR